MEEVLVEIWWWILGLGIVGKRCQSPFHHLQEVGNYVSPVRERCLQKKTYDFTLRFRIWWIRKNMFNCWYEVYLRVGADFAVQASCLLLLQKLSGKGVVWIAGNKIHVQGVLRGHSEVVAVSLYTLEQLFWGVLFQSNHRSVLSEKKCISTPARPLKQ